MKKILSFLFLIFSCFMVFATENASPVPYDKEELPQAIQDIRRFEIITLGAVPFVALDSSLAYSTYKKVSGKSDVFPNPFSSSEENGYTIKEQKALLYTTLGISLGIGVSDLIVRLVKRRKTARVTERITSEHIYITPIALEDDEEIPAIKKEDN